MSNQINIAIDAAVPYQRFITGQDGIPAIDHADTITKLTFTVPPDAAQGKNAKILWGAYGDAETMRWLQVAGKMGDIPYPIIRGVAGTLNFGVLSDEGGQIAVAPGQVVTVTVWQHDPAAPPHHGAGFDKSRNMMFDWHAFA